MISPNELRIGNIVHFLFKNGDHVYKKITPVNAGQIEKMTKLKDISDFWEAIPLTPELLEKCGFKKHNDAEWAIEYRQDLFIVAKQALQLSIYLGFDVEVYIEEEYEDIKFLHQLQNLYFALTGEELTIKL